MAEQIEEKTHAVLSPSGAARWMACPGSVVLEEGRPDSSSKYADWGTVCHEVADLILQGAVGDNSWSPDNAEGFIGRIFTVGDKEYEFDHEMADCVNDYVAHVESFWEPGDILLPETSVPLDHMTGEKDATGTSDCIIIKPSGEIVVIDLKTGKGVMVDADENAQGLMYASGSARENDLLYGPFNSVRIVIIQPRLHHVSEWALDWADFEARIEKIKAAAEEVEDARHSAAGAGDMFENPFDLYLNPGEKQCRFCKAKTICPALRGTVTGALAATADPMKAEDFPDLTLPKQAAAAVDKDQMAKTEDARLSEAMRAAKLVEEWIKAVRAEVERRLFDGQPVPGFKLVEGKRGARFWTDAEKVEERMKKARLKADTMYSKTLISPTKAEELWKAGEIGKKAYADLAEFVDQKDGKPSVASESDPRPEWSPAPPEDFPDLSVEDELFS